MSKQFHADKFWLEMVFAIDHKDPKYLKEFIEKEVGDFLKEYEKIQDENDSLSRELYNFEECEANDCVKINELECQISELEDKLEHWKEKYFLLKEKING